MKKTIIRTIVLIVALYAIIGHQAAYKVEPDLLPALGKVVAGEEEAPERGFFVSTELIDKGLIRVLTNEDVTDLYVTVLPSGTNFNEVNANACFMMTGDDIYPVTQGPGGYDVTIWRVESIGGADILLHIKDIIRIYLPKSVDRLAPFMYENAYITYAPDGLVAKAASFIRSEGYDDEDIVSAINTYVDEYVKYDLTWVKQSRTTEYLISSDKVLEDGTGICWKRSEVYTAIARAMGLPARQVRGMIEGRENPHAWCEVYVGGEWKIIDQGVMAEWTHYPDEWSYR